MSSSLSPSLRDYLETIYEIFSEKGGVRAKDIADRMGVKKSSVTGALRSLSERGLVNYSPYSVITLTNRGRALAREELKRLEALKKFFEKVLSISEDDAERGARETKRNISREMVKRFTQFVEFLEECPRGFFKYNKEHGFHCPPGKCDSEECDSLVGLN
ncbi:metal-dependent transcriptional regulator [Bdellovibrionota bacterium]